MQYVLPLMLTVMSARLIGNVFIDGLYDIHIHTRKLNFLDEDEGDNSEFKCINFRINSYPKKQKLYYCVLIHAMINFIIIDNLLTCYFRS